jgi:predicted phosphohydrolase
MRILVFSDLHLESEAARNRFSLPDNLDFDIAVLAGDIHSYTHGVHWAGKTLRKPAVYVAGNREFYDAPLHSMASNMKKVAAEYPGVHVLENDTVVIDGVRFIGATLWTDFRLSGTDDAGIAAAMRAARETIVDFSTIRFESGKLMTPEDSVHLFRTSAAYIAEELDKPFAGKTVVVTHYPPSRQSLPQRLRSDVLGASFASDLEHLAAKVDGAWIHGHSHFSCNYRIGECQVICNPRGYQLPDAIENNAFGSDVIIEL